MQSMLQGWICPENLSRWDRDRCAQKTCVGEIGMDLLKNFSGWDRYGSAEKTCVGEIWMDLPGKLQYKRQHGWMSLEHFACCYLKEKVQIFLLLCPQGFTILGESFAYVTFFKYFVLSTFPLHGWYMLGVFLLPAFTVLGHKWRDRLSPCNGMHVCTD